MSLYVTLCVSMGQYEALCPPVCLYVTLRHPIYPNGTLCDSVGLYEALCLPMCLYVTLYTPVYPYIPQWNPMSPYVSPRLPP